MYKTFKTKKMIQTDSIKTNEMLYIAQIYWKLKPENRIQFK